MIKKKSAYILIEALVAVAGLLALMSILVGDQKATLDQVQNNLRQTRADAAADAAIQQALAVLSTTNDGLVTLNDPWSQLGSTGSTGTSSGTTTSGNSGSEEFDFPDGTSFRMQIVDASSLINLNNATQLQLEQLPLDQDQVDSLLDWIQPGQAPRTDGAKDTFYNSLPTPYNTALEPLTTVNELLLVDNWTAETIYQPPTETTTLSLPTDSSGNILPLAALFTVDSGAPNVSPTGGTLLNLNTRGVSANTLIRLGLSGRVATTIAARLPYANFAALFAVPGLTTSQKVILLNRVTFTTSTRTTGKINLNTATLPVLESLPLMTPAIAQAIVSQQSSGFSTLGQIATGIGLTPRLLNSLAGSFSVGSDTWIVRAYGQSGGVGQAVEAEVGFRNGTLQIVTINRLHTPGIPSWWGWLPTSTATQQAGVTQ